MTIGNPSETLQWYLSKRNRGDPHTSVSKLLLEKIYLGTDARFLPAVLTDFHLSQWGDWCSSWGLSLSEISLNIFKSIGVASAACRKQGHLHVLTAYVSSVKTKGITISAPALWNCIPDDVRWFCKIAKRELAVSGYRTPERKLPQKLHYNCHSYWRLADAHLELNF